MVAEGFADINNEKEEGYKTNRGCKINKKCGKSGNFLLTLIFFVLK